MKYVSMIYNNAQRKHMRAESDKKEAMNAINNTGHYTMFEIAQYYGVHYSTVSRAIGSLRAKCCD